MTADYFLFLGLFGVAFFAVSGALMGHEKSINGFGVVVVACVTALGGGTIRDLLLTQPIFWVETPSYLYSAYGAVSVCVCVCVSHCVCVCLSLVCVYVCVSLCVTQCV